MVVAKYIRKVGSSKSADKSRARIDSNLLNKINLEASTLPDCRWANFYTHLKKMPTELSKLFFDPNYLDYNSKTLS